ncbi:hypothetical protein KFL_004940135 [Klebsormidium nitens]|uniref:Uncharacterized protein n=1 Tax=Klebsormidium nitens TaxID=105231 RepID=A0A1Y1IGJ7_KLENI|nr:hypothetical protein KFL_004940135 [Klebsormidium nitens]|eukprot:GAQ89182.1 hypothetical protein KFL_004940135 [Klebsormidium nitens]
MLAQGKLYQGGLRGLMDNTWKQARAHTGRYSIDGDLELELEVLIEQYEERGFNHILGDRVIRILSDVVGVEILVYAPFLAVKHAQRFTPEQAAGGTLRPLHLRFNGVNHYDAYIPEDDIGPLYQKETSAVTLDRTATQILKQLAEGKEDAAKDTWRDCAPGRPWNDRAPLAQVLELAERALKKWPLLGHAHYVRALAFQHSKERGACEGALVAAKEALLLGVEERLQARLYRTIAKACFDAEDWGGAFQWYSKCAKEGCLRAEDSVFLDVSQTRLSAQGSAKAEEVAEKVFDLLSDPPAEALLAKFDAVVEGLAAGGGGGGSGSEIDSESESEEDSDHDEPPFQNVPDGAGPPGGAGQASANEQSGAAARGGSSGVRPDFVNLESSDEEDGPTGKRARPSVGGLDPGSAYGYGCVLYERRADWLSLEEVDKLVDGMNVTPSLVSKRPPYAPRGGTVFVVDRSQMEHQEDALYASGGRWFNNGAKPVHGGKLRSRYWKHSSSCNHDEYCSAVGEDDCKGKCFQHRSGASGEPLHKDRKFERRVWVGVDPQGNEGGKYVVIQFVGDETTVRADPHGNRVHNLDLTFEKIFRSTREEMKRRASVGESANKIRRQMQAKARHPGEAPKSYKQAENAKGSVDAEKRGGGRRSRGTTLTPS